MFSRLALSYLLILPVIVPLVVRSIGSDQQYTLLVRMWSNAGGHVQVFYDVGRGYAEADSAIVPLLTSDQPLRVPAALPPATYRSLRLDPGSTGGRYVIEQMAILERDGSTEVIIPLAALIAAHQLVVLERAPGRLVLTRRREQ